MRKHRKQVRQFIPEPQGLRIGSLVQIADDQTAEVVTFRNSGTHYCLGLRTESGNITNLYLDAQGGVLSHPPLRADRLFFSGAIK